ncbi:MAG: hypothetical protein JSS02_06080 [Planctomycetes bacterium]|nr:hypothetical protein [Planctomycetota bacterium]
MSDKRPSPDDFRDWLRGRHEPAALQTVVFQASDSYERAVREGERLEPLAELLAAASHPRVVVWEVALPLLARLAETAPPVRLKIAERAASRRLELRRRSIQYLTDRSPREFSVPLLGRLLHDRSGRVRGFAASRSERLGLTELLPALEQALAVESDSTARFELTYACHMLRDGDFETDRAGYTSAFRSVRTGPGCAVWISQFENAPLTAERVREIGIERLRYAVLERLAGLAVVGV